MCDSGGKSVALAGEAIAVCRCNVSPEQNFKRGKLHGM